MPTYYNTPDPELRPTAVSCLERIKIELNQKPYYKDEVLAMYLEENNLDPSSTYNKDTDRKNLLLTVYAVLEALSNDIDSFRSVSTEFGDVSSAAKYLSERLNTLQKKINSIPNSPDEGEKSIFSFMYYTR